MVVDRRHGERRAIAGRLSDPVSRHELDDLVSVTCAAALRSDILVVCGCYPAEVVPADVYTELVATARANGVPVFVDLSVPGLVSALLGAMAAATAGGETWERSLVLGAAAGAACFLRQGLGSAKRPVIEELADRVQLRQVA